MCSRIPAPVCRRPSRPNSLLPNWGPEGEWQRYGRAVTIGGRAVLDSRILGPEHSHGKRIRRFS